MGVPTSGQRRHVSSSTRSIHERSLRLPPSASRSEIASSRLSGGDPPMTGRRRCRNAAGTAEALVDEQYARALRARRQRCPDRGRTATDDQHVRVQLEHVRPRLRGRRSCGFLVGRWIRLPGHHSRADQRERKSSSPVCGGVPPAPQPRRPCSCRSSPRAAARSSRCGEPGSRGWRIGATYIASSGQCASHMKQVWQTS